MIHNIASELVCDEFEFPNFNNCLKVAECVLKRIEKEGMLPPNVDKFIEGHLCTENEWEKE